MKQIALALVCGGILAVAGLVAPIHGHAAGPPPPPPPNGGTPFPTLGPPCPPSGCPTATPTITPTPLPTNTPTPTNTTIPLFVTVTVQSATVKPGQMQTIQIMTLPGATASATVQFPNGDKKTTSGPADAAGKVTWAYTQPGSTIKHNNHTASVSVQVSQATGSPVSGTGSYTIGYGKVDVSVEPRTPKRGHGTNVWLHSSKNTAAAYDLALKGGLHLKASGKTGSNGWTKFPVLIPSNAGKGSATAHGYAVVKGKTVSTKEKFTVK